MPKRAAVPMQKLLLSAVANAKNAGLSVDTLRVAKMSVDKGIVFKRLMPRARGRGAQILKRTSHVVLVLDQGAVSKKKARRSKNTEAK
jgi:large subunit ribosomal protein L22